MTHAVRGTARPDPARLVVRVAQRAGSTAARGWDDLDGLRLPTGIAPGVTPGQSSGLVACQGSSVSDAPANPVPPTGPRDHEHDVTDDLTDARELGDVPAIEIITRAAVMLMSGAADKLGLGPDEDAAARLDLDEARRLIEALAGLLRGSEPYLGMHRQPLRDGLRALQGAFREASPFPDAPGEGPGERR